MGTCIAPAGKAKQNSVVLTAELTLKNGNKETVVAITYRGQKFKGYNKPKKTPGHKTKSHAVLAKVGKKVKLIRFGQQGVKGAGSNPKTARGKARRRSFLARHKTNIRRGKLSAAYWSAKVKW